MKKPVECLECGARFLSLDAWQIHLEVCVPNTSSMTTSELDRLYQEALEQGARVAEPD